MSNKREEIADKIRALRAKASNVASTEAEAAQAAAMIAKLLSRYDMTEDDVRDYDDDKAGAVQGATDEKMHPVLGACWSGICKLTETEAYKNLRGRLCFVGMEHDVEMALYLGEIITSAADRALKAGFPKATAHQKASFYAGFGAALKEKLVELAGQRQAAKTATGTAIVVRKDQLVRSFLSEAGLKLGKGKGRSTRADAAFYQAGRTVGGAMNLNRPLGTTSSTNQRLK